MVNDASATEDGAGWTIQFGDSVVTQLRVDHRFSLLLGGGALVVLESPFQLRRGEEVVQVPPGDVVSEVAEALPLFDALIDVIVARTSGELRIEFHGGAVVEVPVDPHFENWQIVMPDGEQWIGTPGGGVTHFGS